MTQVQRSDGCDNSPKNLFVQEAAIALRTQGTDFLATRISADAAWASAGRELLRGKTAVLDAVRLAPERLARLTVFLAFTHGKAGAVNGVLEFADGRTEHFCDVFEFSSVKGVEIRAITSYVGER